MPNTSRIELAYAAGWFDAEGSFSIYRHSSRPAIFSPSAAFNYVGDNQIIQFFLRLFGGHFCLGKTFQNKIIRRWKVQNTRLFDFLKLIYPFLIYKKPQAALLFKLRKTLTQSRKGTKGRDFLPEHVLASRISLKAEIEKRNAAFASAPGGTLRPDWNEEESLAYAAGLIDGDGSIYLDSRAHYLTIELSGRAKTLPEWLQNYFGGSLSRVKNNGEMWRWRIGGEEAEKTVLRLSPFLKIKREAMIQSGLYSNVEN